MGCVHLNGMTIRQLKEKVYFTPVKSNLNSIPSVSYNMKTKAQD